MSCWLALLFRFARVATRVACTEQRQRVYAPSLSAAFSLVCRSLSTLGAGYSPAQSSCCWLALPHIFPTCTQGACMFPGYISAHTSLFDCLTRKPQCVTSKGIFFILPVREVPILTVHISTLGIISHICIFIDYQSIKKVTPWSLYSPYHPY